MEKIEETRQGREALRPDDGAVPARMPREPRSLARQLPCADDPRVSEAAVTARAAQLPGAIQGCHFYFCLCEHPPPPCRAAPPCGPGTGHGIAQSTEAQRHCQTAGSSTRPSKGQAQKVHGHSKGNAWTSRARELGGGGEARSQTFQEHFLWQVWPGQARDTKTAVETLLKLTVSRESYVFPGIKQVFPHTYYVLVWCEMQGR